MSSFRQPSALTLDQRIAIVVVVVAAVIAGTFSIPPIFQPQWEYNYADTRGTLGIPNFLNVISNIPFVIVGVGGLLTVFQRDIRRGARFHENAERWLYASLFVGVGLTGFGSAYYHWLPKAERLLWDRLPMVIGFASVVAVIIAERISVRAGVLMLVPLLAAGVASVEYWYRGEIHGAGDLRFYGLVQFAPALVVPLLVWLFLPRYTRTPDWFAALGWYGLAVVFEILDRPIYNLGQFFSGHTLKHFAAAVGTYWIWRMVKRRQLI